MLCFGHEAAVPMNSGFSGQVGQELNCPCGVGAHDAVSHTVLYNPTSSHIVPSLLLLFLLPRLHDATVRIVHNSTILLFVCMRC